MERWTQAFSAPTPDSIVALYAEDASLWGTLSSIRRDTPELICDYFTQVFLFTDRKVVFQDKDIRCYGNMALSSGAYTFSLVRDGEKVVIPSRYSFTYIRQDGDWLIVEQHSSSMPEDK